MQNDSHISCHAGNMSQLLTSPSLQVSKSYVRVPHMDYPGDRFVNTCDPNVCYLARLPRGL